MSVCKLREALNYATDFELVSNNLPMLHLSCALKRFEKFQSPLLDRPTAGRRKPITRWNQVAAGETACEQRVARNFAKENRSVGNKNAL